MSLSISDLLTKLTRDQVRATLVNGLEAVGIPASGWRPGGTFSTILTYVALFLATWQNTIVDGISMGFLETAVGTWLTLLASSVFNITRPPATFATGTVNLANTGGGIYTFGIGGAQFKDSTTGALYTNTASFTSNPSTTIPVPVAAVVVGTGSNAQPSDIDTIVTAMAGVTVTNPAAVLGSDAMNDADLRALCLAKLGTLSNGGPRGAYKFAVGVALNGGTLAGTASVVNGSTTVTFSTPQTLAVGALLSFLAQPGTIYTVQGAVTSSLTVTLTDAYSGASNAATTATTGVPVNINRVGLSEFSSTGTVQVYVAAPTGVPSSGDVSACQASIEALARPTGVTVTVSACAAVPLSTAFHIYSTGAGGVTVAGLQTAAAAALSAAIEGYPIGGLTLPPSLTGKLFAEYARAIVGSSDPSIYYVDDGGASDLTLTAGQVATMSATMTASIVTPPS